MNKTDEQRFIEHYQAMVKLCYKNGWGDPMSFARSKEIYAAGVLGHTVSDTLSGADAYNQNGEPVEYKSTIQKSIKGSYTGISVQPTWKKQVAYLQEDKILKYPEHYFNRFEAGELVESWVLKGSQVYDILYPKLAKKYPNVLKLKDPRLAANVTKREIYKFGKKVI